jgi:hypothetical protein
MRTIPSVLLALFAGAGMAAAQSPADSVLARLQERFSAIDVVLKPYAGTLRADSLLVAQFPSLDSVVMKLNHFMLRGDDLRRGRNLDSLGVWVYDGEGGPHAEVSNSALLRRYGLWLTPDMRSYLAMTAHEQRKPSGGDGSLMLPFDDVADRAVAYYRFAQLPGLATRSDAQQRYCSHMWLIVTGGIHMPHLDRRAGVFRAEMREPFARFAGRYADLRPGRIFARYLDVLRAGGYRATPAAVAHLDSITRSFLRHPDPRTTTTTLTNSTNCSNGHER